MQNIPRIMLVTLVEVTWVNVKNVIKKTIRIVSLTNFVIEIDFEKEVKTIKVKTMPNFLVNMMININLDR